MNEDAAFRALADASRRQLLDRLHRKNGQTLDDLCPGLDMTRTHPFWVIGQEAQPSAACLANHLMAAACEV